MHKHEYLRSNLGCWLRDRHPSSIAPAPTADHATHKPEANFIESTQIADGGGGGDDNNDNEDSVKSMTMEEFEDLQREIDEEDAARVSGTKGAFSWLFGSDVEQSKSVIGATVERLRLKLRGASRESGYNAKDPKIVKALETVELFLAP